MRTAATMLGHRYIGVIRQAGFSGGTPWIELNQTIHESMLEESISESKFNILSLQEIDRITKSSPSNCLWIIRSGFEEHDKVFAYVRELDGEQLLVVCNFSGSHSLLKRLNNIKLKHQFA